VRWKGYLPAHDSWVNSEDLHTPDLLADFESQPSTGFATSTIFTLGTDDGIILIRMHTDDNQLHFFGTFVRQGHFDIGYHWTTWRPRENFDAINIDHEAIVVPVNNEDPVLRTHVNFERFPFAPHPPRYQPQPATPFNIVIPT